MQRLTLASAQTIIAQALATRAELDLQPLVVAVLDLRGVLKAYAAEEGTSLLRFQIAHGKAFGALGMGLGSAELERRAKGRPHFMNAVTALAGGALVPVAGGVLIRDDEGEIVGAVGISGDTSENDERCAVAGIGTAGFIADPG